MKRKHVVLTIFALMISTLTFISADDIKPGSVEPSELQNVEYLIPDIYLRKAVNKSLKKKPEETYNASKEELATIERLDISAPSQQLIQIHSVEGLELLTSLKTIVIQAAFIPQNTFDVLANLDYLKTVQLQNTYINGERKIIMAGKIVNGEAQHSMLFNEKMEIDRLATSNSIESISIEASQFEYTSKYNHRKRGHLIVENLGQLTSLKELNIGGFVDVDDYNMEFIKPLANLEILKISEIPFNNADSILEAKKLSEVRLNDTAIKDFSNIIDLVPSDNISVSQVITGPDPFTKEDNRSTAIINTGIYLPANFTVDTIKNLDQTFDIEPVSSDTNELKFKITSKSEDFKTYKLTNPIDDSESKFLGAHIRVSLKNGETNRSINYNSVYLTVTEYHSVSFETNGGNKIESIMVEKDKQITTLPTPEKENHIFEGWYADELLETPWKTENQVSENITLYAKWSLNEVPDEPGETEEPNKPGETEDPNNPSETEEPNKPGETEEPNKPGEANDTSSNENGTSVQDISKLPPTGISNFFIKHSVYLSLIGLIMVGLSRKE